MPYNIGMETNTIENESANIRYSDFDDITVPGQKSLIDYWKSHGLKIDDFYCRECGKFMVDLENLRESSGYFPSAPTWQNKFRQYVESPKNMWLIKGRNLSGRVFFRHLCWDCFFRHLPEVENISKRALKSSWYRDVKAGNLRPPAPWTSPSKYFKLLFDITDSELEVEHKKFDTASMKSFVRRFGSDRAQAEYEKYTARQAYTCSKEYMMNEKGMTEDEWNRFNAGRAVTREHLVERHGVEVGERMWREYCDRQSYAGCKLEYFIEKYGEEEGRAKYVSVNKMKVLSYENFVRKYGKDEGERRWNAFVEDSKRQYSKISQELFEKIDRKDPYSLDNSIYASKSGNEFSLTIEIDGQKRLCHVDFILGKKVIEFYGEFYHADPRRYLDTDVIFGRTAKEVRDRNAAREAALKAAGYSVKVVWEMDYMAGKKKVVSECLEFLHS